MLDFKEWYEAYGMLIEDKLREWFEKAPDEAEVDELVGDVDEYIQACLETQHERYISGYADHRYQEMKDDF